MQKFHFTYCCMKGKHSKFQQKSRNFYLVQMRNQGRIESRHDVQLFSMHVRRTEYFWCFDCPLLKYMWCMLAICKIISKWPFLYTIFVFLRILVTSSTPSFVSEWCCTIVTLIREKRNFCFKHATSCSNYSQCSFHT